VCSSDLLKNNKLGRLLTDMIEASNDLRRCLLSYISERENTAHSRLVMKRPAILGKLS